MIVIERWLLKNGFEIVKPFSWKGSRLEFVDSEYKYTVSPKFRVGKVCKGISMYRKPKGIKDNWKVIDFGEKIIEDCDTQRETINRFKMYLKENN